MTPVAIAALGRREGRYAFMVWGPDLPAGRGAGEWLESHRHHLPDATEQRLYVLAFDAAFAEAAAGRQRAAQRFDPLEDS